MFRRPMSEQETHLDAHISNGTNAASGAVAEILSILETTSFWKNLTDAGVSLDLLLAALDTRSPAEDRVQLAANLINKIRRTARLGRWLPWYDKISEHEFAQEFHPGHRDHAIHTLQVFLLGLYLYATNRTLSQALDRYFTVPAGALRTSQDVFWEWWCLTGLWHDIGYPLEADQFIPNEQFRTKQLQRLSSELGENPFESGFTAANIHMTSQLRREVYKAGRYSPIHLDSIEPLFNTPGDRIIHTMWTRLGLRPSDNSLARSLDRITTQAPRERPPYHDHGLMGALLLSLFITEARSFLQELFNSPSSASLDPIRDIALEAWDDFEKMAHATDSAIEAIAFHNFNFGTLDQQEVRNLLQMPDQYPAAKLSREPHLVFVALADTLQDWDRNHFLPNTAPHSFRRAVPSANMLIQGDGDFIRLSIKDKPGAAAEAQKLFRGWVDEQDIKALIKDKAKFTLPNRLLAGSTSSLRVLRDSKTELSRLSSLINKAVSESKARLISGGAESILDTSYQIESIKRQIRDASEVLTAADNTQIKETLIAAGLSQIEAQTAFLIKPGTRLRLGTVKGKIGQGGFGTVYLLESNAGTDSADTVEMAFKLFHANDLEIEEKRRLFRRGFDAMSALQGYPGVVRILSFSELPVGFYMDYVPGGDLDSSLTQLRTLAERLDVALKIAQTLAFAHARGVLHRDIKPGNVLLDSNKELEPILTDFDLAWMDGRTMNTKLAYASYHFGAPEQFLDRLADYRKKPTVDIYGMGALVYYLMTNQNPPGHTQWSDDSWREFENRLEGQLPAACVAQLLDLVKGATVPAPDERIQSMEEIVSRLSRCYLLATRTDSVMTKNDWLTEVVYRATGQSQSTRQFRSRAGGVTWVFERFEDQDDGFRLTLVFIMNAAPRYEGVNYEGFQKGSVKQIDSRVHVLRKEWPMIRITRHGQLYGAGSKAELELLNVPRTVQSAEAISQLISSISRIIE
jgi:hypothetical protein